MARLVASPTPEEMRIAADTIEKWFVFIQVPDPEHCAASAFYLRIEADRLESENNE